MPDVDPTLVNNIRPLIEGMVETMKKYHGGRRPDWAGCGEICGAGCSVICQVTPVPQALGSAGGMSIADAIR